MDYGVTTDGNSALQGIALQSSLAELMQGKASTSDGQASISHPAPPPKPGAADPSMSDSINSILFALSSKPPASAVPRTSNPHSRADVSAQLLQLLGERQEGDPSLDTGPEPPHYSHSHTLKTRDRVIEQSLEFTRAAERIQEMQRHIDTLTTRLTAAAQKVDDQDEVQSKATEHYTKGLQAERRLLSYVPVSGGEISRKMSKHLIKRHSSAVKKSRAKDIHRPKRRREKATKASSFKCDEAAVDEAHYSSKKQEDSITKASSPNSDKAAGDKDPLRKIDSVYRRVTRIYHPGNYKGVFSAEEEKQMHELVQQHTGHRNKWSVIGALMGRTRFYCRELWLFIRLGEKKRNGKWSSEEENRLRLLVREQIAARKEKEAAELKLRLEQMSTMEGAAAVCRTPSDGRHFRDRVDFGPISEMLGTRVYKQCHQKWYGKLSPSLYTSGEWALGDDITMVRALQSSSCEWPWEVEWDDLVPNRIAELAKRRWRSMLKALPDYLEKSFDVCVEELAEKYSSNRCRQLLENLNW
eukprot:gene25778-11446_t